MWLIFSSPSFHASLFSQFYQMEREGVKKKNLKEAPLALATLNIMKIGPLQFMPSFSNRNNSVCFI